VATGTKAEKALLQPGMDVEFCTQMSAHVKREQSLQSNLPKAFAYIMNDYCTDGLKTRLIAIPDYESNIRGDPLALLTAIKTCAHENAHTQCPPVTILTHWDRLLKLKQAEDEDPPSYAKCFEQQLETVKGYIGSTFLVASLSRCLNTRPMLMSMIWARLPLCSPPMWRMKMPASPWLTISVICSVITNLRRRRTKWILKLRLDPNSRPTSSSGLSLKPSVAHS